MGHTAIAEIQVSSSHARHSAYNLTQATFFVANTQFADYIFPAFDQVRLLFPSDLSLYPRILTISKHLV